MATLYDYYTKQGKPLPTVAERSATYQQLGLGPANTYVGSAEQNNKLLAALGGSQTTAAVTGAAAGATTGIQPPNPQPAPIQPVVKTPAQPETPSSEPQTAQDLVNMGFTGYTGWNDKDAVADYKATRGQGKGSATSNGTTGMPSSVQTPQLQAIYDMALKSSNYETLQANITAAQKKIDDRNDELAKATNEINNNPFLSEASRVGRIRRLTEYAQDDINNMTNELSLAQAASISAQNDAKLKVDIATGQYSLNKQAYDTALSTFNTLLSSGALNNATPADIANIAGSIGVSSSVVQSAITTAKQKSIPTQVLTATNDAGVVTAVVLNSDTGEVISKTNLGSIGNAQNGKTPATIGSPEYKATSTSALNQFISAKTNSYGHIGPTDWTSALSAYLADALGTKNDFITAYASYTDPNRGDFETAYGFPKTKRDELTL